MKIFNDALKVDEEVQVQVVDLDEFTGKASLSIRTLEGRKAPVSRDGDAFQATVLTTASHPQTNDANFGQGSPSTFEEAEALVRNPIFFVMLI